ncbi:hypothetical protein [Sinomonas albida]|uniref:hypothetical protein n=1 Tax=Sinomonas albida TaxID=369942 RepID=UPI0010A83A37|nr:hypothetical protein [Sinomonas albida]
MRWEALFSDFEAQLAEADRAGLEAEVRELVWVEQAGISLEGRLRGHSGAPVDVVLCGGLRFRGEIGDVAESWFSLSAGSRSLVVPFSGVVTVAGLGRRSQRETSAVRRGLSLASALRALARARAQVVCHVGGPSGDPLVVAGTIDGVSRDYVELAQKRVDARGAQASTTTLVSLAALVAVVSPA